MTDYTQLGNGEIPDHGPTNGSDIAIVQIVLQQLTLMEARLGNRIDRIDAADAKRWTTHVSEHDDLIKAVQGIGHRLDDHLRKEAQEDLIFDARVGPLRRVGALVSKEWRTVAIIVLLLADFIGRFAQDVINLK